jgi:hypothetical protein
MSTPIPTLQVKPGYKPRAGWAQELAIQGIEKTVKKREKLEQELRKRHRELNTFPKRLIPGDITFDLSMTPILTRTTLPTELEELEPPPLPPKKGIHKPIARGPFKVAIVGAGAAGLFTGMIFDYLNQQNKAGSHGFLVEYEILESASTAGGRLSTYNFKTGLNGADDGAHVYYDVGAMRFPNNPVMTRYVLP